MIRIGFISLFIFLAACESDKTETNTSPTTVTKEASSNATLEDKKLMIDDNEDNYTAANSLTFTHNDGSYAEALAFLDTKKNILKIIEKFTDASTGNTGTRVFYLENNKKFMSVERFVDNAASKGAFKERISYYDANGAPLSSKERLSQFEENLEKEKFIEIKPYDCSMKRAEQVLNNEGVFATTFQGFFESGSMNYLLVGGPGETGYASALGIQFVDDQITYLRNNERASVGKPLKVDFERMRDDKNMEFQILIHAQME